MRKALLILTILTISFLSTSCLNENELSSKPQTQITNYATPKEQEIVDNGPVKGGTVRLFSTKPDTLNPILTDNAYVQDFSNFVFEGMFKLAKDQSLIPVLCDKWDVSADGLVWNFHIRENVLWHNNTELTADDIKFTFDVINNIGLKSIYKKNLDNVATYAAIDSYNFKVILKKQDSFLAENLTFPIISQNYFSGEDISKLNSIKNMTPVGTGPFKYNSYNGYDTLSFKANDKWWNKNADTKNKLDLPYISGLDIKIYKNGTDALTAFQTRDVDVAILPISDFNKYNGRSDLVVRKFISKNFEFLSFNLFSSIMGDKAVRQAIAYAIDKAAMIYEIIPGQAISSDLPIIQDSWANSTNINFYSQDKIKAKETLVNGGWKEEKTGDTNAYFKSIKGIKTKLKLNIMVNDFNDIRYKMAEFIAAQLKDIGIEVNITKLSWDNEIKNIAAHKYDMAIMGYKISSVPDVSFAFSSTDILSGLNVSGYNNPLVDSIFEQLRNENDQDKKKSLINNLKDIVSDDVPFLGLYFYNNAVIYSKKIRGEMNPMVWDKFNDITRWYILSKN